MRVTRREFGKQHNRQRETAYAKALRWKQAGGIKEQRKVGVEWGADAGSQG